MTAPATYANHVAMHAALDLAPVLQGQGLGGMDLLVLIVIARHMGRDGQPCWLASETVATEAACCRRTVTRAVKALVKAGVLAVVGKRNGRTNLYEIAWDLRQIVTCDSESHAPNSPITCDSESTDLRQIVPSRETNSPITCDSLAHEVVPEVVPEVEKGSSAIPSTEAGGAVRAGEPQSQAPDRQTGKPQTGGAGSKAPAGPKFKFYRQEQQGVAAVTAKPEILTTPETPVRNGSPEARELSNQYWELLEGPDEQIQDRDITWPLIFDELLTGRTAETLSAVITWAFQEDDFWPDKLVRRNGDPVQYFAAKLPTMLPQYRQWSAKQKVREKQASSATPTITDPKIARLAAMFKPI